MSEHLNEILSLVRRGWRVHPCKPDKTPTLKDWPTNATNNEALVPRWFGNGEFVGVVTGESFVVLDTDPPAGEESLATLEKELGTLPESPMVLTPRGGKHRYLASPDGDIRNSAGVLGPNLDVRGRHGYCIVPPSQGYRWIRPLAGDLPPLPISWLERLRTRAPVEPVDCSEDEMIPEGRRHDRLVSLAGSMRRRGFSQGAIESALLRENQARCRPSLDEREVKRIAASTGRYPTSSSSKRRVVFVRQGELHATVDSCVEILADLPEGGRLYSRGGTLVRVLEREEDRQLRGAVLPAGGITIQTIDRHLARYALNRVASFQSFTAKGGTVLQDCPTPVATILARLGAWPGVPELTSVVTGPTLLPDGRVLQDPGYDPDSGVLYRPGSVRFNPIPEKPTKDCAIRCARQLHDEILIGFPFVDDVDRGVALAALLTTVSRSAYPHAPLFGINAPAAGTGKSLLAESAIRLATGTPAACATVPDNSEELRKLLFALLLEGERAAILDNVEHALASDSLCSLLTQQSWKQRILGVSQTAAVPTEITLFVTGNGLVVRGDLIRRTLLCDLDAKTEKPDERRFDRDLFRHVEKHRGELLPAALTVLAAYNVAGRPSAPGTPMGGFEAWSDLVRGALLWLGFADPRDSRGGLEAADPARAAEHTILEGWHVMYGGTRAGVGDLLRDLPANRGRVLDLVPGFEDALIEVAGDRGGEKINRRRLGWWCRKQAGRVVNGRRLVRVTEDADAAVYRLETLERAES